MTQQQALQRVQALLADLRRIEVPMVIDEPVELSELRARYGWGGGRIVARIADDLEQALRG